MSLLNTPITIELDKPRQIIFSVGSATRVKRAIGLDVMRLTQQEWAEAVVDPEKLPAILWACMVSCSNGDAPKTADQVGDLISSFSLMETAAQGVLRAYMRFTGMTDEQIEQAVVQAKAARDAAPEPPVGASAEDPQTPGPSA